MAKGKARGSGGPVQLCLWAPVAAPATASGPLTVDDYVAAIRRDVETLRGDLCYDRPFFEERIAKYRADARRLECYHESAVSSKMEKGIASAYA